MLLYIGNRIQQDLSLHTVAAAKSPRPSALLSLSLSLSLFCFPLWVTARPCVAFGFTASMADHKR